MSYVYLHPANTCRESACSLPTALSCESAATYTLDKRDERAACPATSVNAPAQRVRPAPWPARMPARMRSGVVQHRRFTEAIPAYPAINALRPFALAR
eukprot:917093-Prymnesium_polylepis.1